MDDAIESLQGNYRKYNLLIRKLTIHFYWERRQISFVVNLKVAFRKEPKDFFGGTESIIISSDAVYYVFCR
jgi:hypothetical protein